MYIYTNTMNRWNKFLKQYRGSGLTSQQLGKIYRSQYKTTTLTMKGGAGPSHIGQQEQEQEHEQEQEQEQEQEHVWVPAPIPHIQLPEPNPDNYIFTTQAHAYLEQHLTEVQRIIREHQRDFSEDNDIMGHGVIWSPIRENLAEEDCELTPTERHHLDELRNNLIHAPDRASCARLLFTSPAQVYHRGIRYDVPYDLERGDLLYHNMMACHWRDMPHMPYLGLIEREYPWMLKQVNRAIIRRVAA